MNIMSVSELADEFGLDVGLVDELSSVLGDDYDGLLNALEDAESICSAGVEEFS
jgi:hypothetical protein